MPGVNCQAHYRDNRRAGENPNLQLRVTTTLCRPAGQTVAPEEVMALVQALRFS